MDWRLMKVMMEYYRMIVIFQLWPQVVLSYSAQRLTQITCKKNWINSHSKKGIRTRVEMSHCIICPFIGYSTKLYANWMKFCTNTVHSHSLATPSSSKIEIQNYLFIPYLLIYSTYVSIPSKHDTIKSVLIYDECSSVFIFDQNFLVYVHRELTQPFASAKPNETHFKQMYGECLTLLK